MITSFAARGLVEFVPALAVMLGANVGTTIIVQAMAFDVYKVAPILVLAGLLLFRRGRTSRTRDFGRVAIGLGLMLFALRALMIMVAPSEDTPFLRLLLDSITSDPLIAAAIAAGLAWAAHSSVAVVLLIMSFVANGAIPLDAALALVLGANLGTSINPLVEAQPAAMPPQNGSRSAISSAASWGASSCSSLSIGSARSLAAWSRTRCGR